MIYDSNLLLDGFDIIDKGVNSGVDYSLLPRNQFAFMVNGTFRGGYPQCRPGFDPVELNVPDGSTDNWSDGLWQGASTFVIPNANPKLVCSVSGRIYAIDCITWDVSDVTPGVGTSGDDPNNAAYPKTWWVQAVNWLVIQNKVNKAIIYDGGTCRRSDPNKREIPAGTAMAYVNGRIWLGQGQQYIAGDIVGGGSGTDDGKLNAVLRFTENTYINDGGAFSVPIQSGEITGMRAMTNITGAIDTGTLYIFTEGAVFSVNAPADRTVWKTMTDPIARTMVSKFGSQNAFGIVESNGDLYYRSSDGVRSVINALRTYGVPGNTPLSNEMKRTLSTDYSALLKFGSGVLFDNRLIETVTPQRDSKGTYHLGLAVLDFDLISNIQQKAPPVWDGLWTGLKILQMLTIEINGVERCFAFVRGEDSIELWEISKSKRFDDRNRRIQWGFESSSLDFQSKKSLKSLRGGDLGIKDLTGQCDFDVKYKTDHYAGAQDWNSFSQCANYEDCTAEGCGYVFKDVNDQYRPRLDLPRPEYESEDATDKPFREFYTMGVTVNITGFCTVTGVRVGAQPVPERGIGFCQEDGACFTQAFCKANPYSYESS